MDAAPECPKCSKPMSEGSLGTMSYVGGAQWYPHRSRLATAGETILSLPFGGMAWLDGFRCDACHLLQLSY